MRMMRMIQKVALNSLKIGYVQVKTPKFPKPCSLACNCKIIWDSDFDEGCQENFKVTLLERPSEKSCSTSQKKRGFQGLN